jgi:hypothetical protein
VDKRKLAFTIALTPMIWLLTSCSRNADGAHDLKGTFYPLDLALTCDQSTPSPVRSEYPARDSENAVGTICIERNSGTIALSISKIDIHRDEAFHDPVYEVQFHIDQKDRQRMEAAMSKAVQTHRMIAFVVHGAVVAQAAVMDPPKDGVIMMGGYDNVKEAGIVAARFKAPTQ